MEPPADIFGAKCFATSKGPTTLAWNAPKILSFSNSVTAAL